jgi:hypothetical protein
MICRWPDDLGELRRVMNRAARPGPGQRDLALPAEVALMHSPPVPTRPAVGDQGGGQASERVEYCGATR